MPPLLSDRVARFARMPRNPAEVWQGSLVRLPVWVEKGPDGKPYRPNGAFCVSLLSGRVHQKGAPEPGSPDPSMLLECLLEFGCNRELAGCRPGRIEVADPHLAAYLQEHLGACGVAVTAAADVSALKEVLDHFGEYMNQRPLPPNALDVPGVTVERMRAFAEAATRFYIAAPWGYLTDEDLVHIEAPEVAPGLKYLTVMGGAGLTFGIGFYDHPDEFKALLEAEDPEFFVEDRAHWSVLYGPIHDLPLGDADLWLDAAFPVAGDAAYPVAVQFGPGEKIRRPDAAILASMEAFLSALAETTEPEIDQGRWTKHVNTASGRQTITFCIPELLVPFDVTPTEAGVSRRAAERILYEAQQLSTEFEDPDAQDAAFHSRLPRLLGSAPSTASSPPEHAQDLVERAYDSRGRRRIQLVRKALELWPDCADAYTLLAEEADSPETSLKLYRQAVAAGERALGSDVFEQEVGRFWGLTATRPYMRARFGLARCMAELGQSEDSIRIYRDLLRLNPHDNQGVRGSLFPALLEIGADDEAGALLQQFAGDVSAQWQYGWALWLFRAEGDSPASRERLQMARRANRYVPDYLTGKATLGEELPDVFAYGSKEEAILCADALFNVWQTTAGAVRWMESAKPTRAAKKRRRR